MTRFRDVLLIIFCFLFPKTIFLFLFKGSSIVDKMLPKYGIRDSFWYKHNYSRYCNKSKRENVLVYRNKGSILDTGAISDYVDVMATANRNGINVTLIMSKNNIDNIEKDLYYRFFQGDTCKKYDKKLSLNVFIKEYKFVSFGTYLSLNKRKIFAFSKHVYYKDDIIKYFREDNARIPQDCVGVFMRGTDYSKLKPKNHPRLPTIEEVFNSIDGHFKDKIIYLATEDSNIVDAFIDKYGKEMIYTNKTIYLNIDGQEDVWVSSVKIGIEDEYFVRSLTYLSSMYVLGHCKNFVGCVAGGSIYTLTMYGNNYKKRYLLKRGFNR